MNDEPLFAVAMPMVPTAGFAVLAGSLRRRDFGISYSTFSGRKSTDGRRLCGIGRQDVYLRCINNKVLEGQASGVRGRKA
ncbi:hypothetical protein [Rhodanobacter sp. B04]|uniref:hypothetical protein n=1 Tax=Rhodanobacter sp. B04 TaxID=1945860 RepID=UPI0011158FE7|nr:hypothetical protein [Rhodanobacter sp. B04]